MRLKRGIGLFVAGVAVLSSSVGVASAHQPPTPPKGATAGTPSGLGETATTLSQTLTLRAGRKAITKGQKVRLRGRAPAGSKVVVRGLRKSVEWRIGKYTQQPEQIQYKWRKIATTRSNRRGRWTVHVSPKNPTSYQAKVGKRRSAKRQVDVWRWTPLKHRSRSTNGHTSGTSSIQDYVVGAVEYRDALTLVTASEQWTDAMTYQWVLGGKCTRIKGGLGIPDKQTHAKDKTASVQWRTESSETEEFSAKWAQVTTFSMGIPGAQFVEVSAAAQQDQSLSIVVALTNGKVYCKN